MNFKLKNLRLSRLNQEKSSSVTSFFFIQELFVLVKRLFIQLKRRPITLISGILQPLLWLILFGALFQKAPFRISNLENNYLQFFYPGILVFTAFAGSLNSSLPLIFDREFGFLNRLLVAPLNSRFSILFSSAFFISVLSFIQVFFIMLFGVFLGIQLPPFKSLIVSFFFLFLLIIGITTFSILLALLLPTHIELIAVIFVLNLPLLFSSTALAPLDFMPSWLQIISCLNPLTYTIEPIRFLYSHSSWLFSSSLFELSFFSINIGQSLIILIIFDLVGFLLFKKILKSIFI
uniref:Putative transport permease ycf38 n=1 Tax=Cyanophora paradoxa TaxID=2762 RepID=YCF38_CYAPA|nr:hypothetical protein CypaCp031 [Cyanophora paradoxa]P48278.1 RecName: Full=Putative transport permease ycf38 [Cyanophora paradoxa]AAA81199.1 ycf38 [Cyanophora paradoxa]